MHKTSILLGLMLLATSALADMGFYHSDQFPTGTPAAISAAVPSVFKLWVPGGNVILTLNEWTDDELTARIAAAEAKKDYLTSSQLTFCKRTQVRPCLVFDDVTSGTGFPMIRDNLLWTNRHLFLDLLIPWSKAWKALHPQATDADVADWVFHFEPPLLIYDQNDHLLHTEDGTRRFRYIKFGPNAGTMTDPAFMAAFSTDIAVLELPNPLARALKLASSKASPGDVLYTMGYPIATDNRRQEWGTPDSTGQSKLHMSFGPKISVDEGLQRLSKMNSAVRDLRERLNGDSAQMQIWNNVLQMGQIDSESGNSGGPVMNARGEVVSIFSAHMLEYRGSDPSMTIGLTIDLTSITNNPDFNF